MKKVININLHGRVIPIEESAYEELRGYSESLRVHFAAEEGRDEIINDIENRIAELFQEKLQLKPDGCITDADLSEVLASMGRPEDFGETVTEPNPAREPVVGEGKVRDADGEPRGSLYRNANDRFLGGVCSGIAHYLKLDPSVVRILFAVITFGGFGSGFLLYLILWAIIPSRPLSSTVRRRLYRNREEKLIGGVCSGLSSYFQVGVWIPRLVFLLPIVLSMFANIFGNGFDNTDIVFGSFGGTLFMIYLVLWIVLPLANTTSEKLEMRGEKVDLQSIRQAVQEDLQELKGRSGEVAGKVREKAEQIGGEMRERTETFSRKAQPVAIQAVNRVGHVIAVLVKAFLLFMVGIIVFALFMTLMAVTIVYLCLMPLRGFFLSGFWQQASVWGILVLFLAVPILGLVVWLIRRITGSRSGKPRLAYVFTGLWTLGWVSLITFIGLLAREYRSAGEVGVTTELSQPTNRKLEVVLGDIPGRYRRLDWFDGDGSLPALTPREDSMLMNTVRIVVTRSRDSLYHARVLKMAKGGDMTIADKRAAAVAFDLKQQDSLLTLPKGFGISRKDGFGNQQVMLVLEVPQGARIRIDKGTDWFDWLSINKGMRGLNIQTEDYGFVDGLPYKRGVWYVMTAEGLQAEGADGREETDEWKGTYRKTEGRGKREIRVGNIRIIRSRAAGGKKDGGEERRKAIVQAGTAHLTPHPMMRLLRLD